MAHEREPIRRIRKPCAEHERHNHGVGYPHVAHGTHVLNGGGVCDLASIILPARCLPSFGESRVNGGGRTELVTGAACAVCAVGVIVGGDMRAVERLVRGNLIAVSPRVIVGDIVGVGCHFVSIPTAHMARIQVSSTGHRTVSQYAALLA